MKIKWILLLLGIIGVAAVFSFHYMNNQVTEKIIVAVCLSYVGMDLVLSFLFKESMCVPGVCFDRKPEHYSIRIVMFIFSCVLLVVSIGWLFPLEVITGRSN